MDLWGQREGWRKWERGTEGEGGRKIGVIGQDVWRPLPHSKPIIPTTECVLSFSVSRILFILFSLPRVALFPRNILIPTFLSVEHCASNAKHKPR